MRFFFGLALGLGLAALVAFNALLVWVATGPRSLEPVTPYIETALEPLDHSYSVRIGETWLIWDGWKNPVDLRLRNVTISKEGRRFSSFPEISLGLYVPSLLTGSILPTSLTVTKPRISLVQQDDRSLTFGFNKADTAEEVDAATEDFTTIPLPAVLAPLLSPDGNGPLRKLRVVSIQDGTIRVVKPGKGRFFKATGANLVFKRDRNYNLEMFGSVTAEYDKYQSLIDVQVSHKKGTPIVSAEVRARQLMPNVLADLFLDKTFLSGLQFPVSGKANLTWQTEGGLDTIAFTADAGKGTFVSDKLAQPLPVTSLHIEGGAANHFSDIQITTLKADLDGMLIDGDGKVHLEAGNDPTFTANFFLKNVPGDKVAMLWPPSLAPMTREWVTENISGGVVPQAESHFDVKKGDITPQGLAKEAVHAVIDITDAKIRYLQDHPQITKVYGRLTIDGKSMVADITSGDYLKDSKLSNGKLVIDDLHEDNPYIKLSFDADASARDVVKLLSLPKLRHAERLNLAEDKAEGTMKGKGTMGFRFFAPKDKDSKDDDLTFEITADVKDIGAEGFMKRFDIKNATGKALVNNEQVDFQGSGTVNGATASDTHIRYLFTPKDGLDTFIDVTGTAPVESLPRFGYPAFTFLKGGLGLKASLKQGAATEFSDATIDLTNADINVPALGWHKPVQEAATLTLTGDKEQGVARIPSFTLKSKDADIRGFAEFNTELTAVRKVGLDKFEVGGSNLYKLVYEVIDGGMKLEAEGARADLGPWLDSSEGSKLSFEHFPAFVFRSNVEKVIFGKSRLLQNVKGDMSCDTKRCTGANIKGSTFDGKPFTFRISQTAKDKRQLAINADNAGEFLRALRLQDYMQGGVLEVNGTFDDSGKGGGILRGRADIDELMMKDAPVLAKILSLASLTGFFDTLQGNGIRFTKASVPFTLNNDVITLDKAKMFGPSIGITGEGTITFPAHVFDITGTVVPAYSLNSVFGKVPLVGYVLTGGEGQGIFAAKYSVKGPEEDPKVMVNPLSILTPGFLRGLFDILDEKKAPDKDEKR